MHDAIHTRHICSRFSSLLSSPCRCLGDEPKAEAPLEKNPAVGTGSSQSGGGTPGQQAIPPSPPQTQPPLQDQQHQQQQQQQQATVKLKDTNAGEDVAAKTPRQSQTPGDGDPVKLAAGGDHGDAVKGVEVEGSKSSVGETASAESDPVSNWRSFVSLTEALWCSELHPWVDRVGDGLTDLFDGSMIDWLTDFGWYDASVWLIQWLIQWLIDRMHWLMNGWLVELIDWWMLVGHLVHFMQLFIDESWLVIWFILCNCCTFDKLQGQVADQLMSLCEKCFPFFLLLFSESDVINY